MKKNLGVIIVAGGSSSRMGGTDKLFASLCGIPVIEHTVRAFLSCESVREIVISARRERLGELSQLLEKYTDTPITITEGGENRFFSARNGFRALSEECEYIAVHDGARPLVSAETISGVLSDAVSFGAAIAAASATDTVKIEKDGFISLTPNRSDCYLAQTPQIFERKIYSDAIEQALQSGKTDFTDDAQLVEASGKKVRITRSSGENIKITVESDLSRAEQILSLRYTEPFSEENMFRIGHGYDVHRLVQDRELWLGGIKIPFEKGLLGHSDADVLLHAVMDAVLGALALGDIGQHFSDKDEKYRNISSLMLLEKVIGMMNNNGFVLGNLDCTVIAQEPKLAAFIPQMRRTVAEAFSADISLVSIKATTEEGLGLGNDGIGAHAVCILKQKP